MTRSTEDKETQGPAGEDAADPGGGLAERLLAIGRDCARRLRKAGPPVDIDELLYDERGLPKGCERIEPEEDITPRSRGERR